jgi:hypothetical protein
LNHELISRLKKGLTSPLRGLVLTTNRFPASQVRDILQKKGLTGLVEVRVLPANIKEAPSALVLVRIRESVCDKKCYEKCGSKEARCYGKCLYECIGSLQEIIEEKLGEAVNA